MCEQNHVFCEKEALMKEELIKVIDKCKDMPGALIPVLHEAQGIYGYLPPEAMKMIADGLNLPVAKVYGVATFYSQFSLTQKGKYRVSVCLGTACYVKGAAEILDKFKERLALELGECSDDGLFSLDACRCIGACSLAPVVMINDDVYGKLKPEDIDKLISKYEEMEAEN